LQSSRLGYAVNCSGYDAQNVMRLGSSTENSQQL